MSTLSVQFVKQDDSSIFVIEASVLAALQNPVNAVTILAKTIVQYVEMYSSILDDIDNPFVKGITQMMLIGTLDELKQDATNLPKIVAVCYLLHTLENGKDIQAFKILIGDISYVHKFDLNPISSDVFVASTLRS